MTGTRPFTPEDFLAIRGVEDPQVSPDGGSVVLVVLGIDAERYEYRRVLWLADVETGDSKQLADGPADSSTRWSPDSRQVAFLRAPTPGTKAASVEELERGVASPQLWLQHADGGEARQLTQLRHGAGAAAWRPGSAEILFSAPGGSVDDEAAVLAEAQGMTWPQSWLNGRWSPTSIP